MTIRESFEVNGFYLAKGVFNPQEVLELETDFDQIVAQLLASNEDINARWSGPEVEKLGAQNSVVFHTHNVQQYSAAWARALFHPEFVRLSTEVLGPNVVMHHTKLFQKPAEMGAPFPMHQDWGYFPTIHDTMMAGIIHVSAATDAMGCLRVYPGSHKLGRLDSSLGGSEALLEDYPIERATVLEAEPGDVLFFHYLLIHGSMPNRSDRVRKTVLVQLHSGQDAVEDWVTHPNERLVLAGWNAFATRESANRSK